MEYKKFFWKRFLGHLISMPLLWMPLPILIVLDVITEIYHHLCFPIYGIPLVKRSEYMLVLDRNKLPYLNLFEKLGCMYCGYANGLALYFKEIAGRTEKYWCGIIHQNKPGFKTQEHQIKQNFAKFADEEDFKRKYLNKKA